MIFPKKSIDKKNPTLYNLQKVPQKKYLTSEKKRSENKLAQFQTPFFYKKYKVKNNCLVTASHGSRLGRCNVWDKSYDKMLSVLLNKCSVR